MQICSRHWIRSEKRCGSVAKAIKLNKEHIRCQLSPKGFGLVKREAGASPARSRHRKQGAAGQSATGKPGRQSEKR